jgi:ABC-2 type transport system permease protein
MFAHIFKYRLKCLLGGRAEIFWTLIYPIVLATFFSLAFSNLSKAESFKAVEIAVVDNTEFRNDQMFQSVLDSVSDESNEDSLFSVTLTTEEDAEARLDKNWIQGYIIFDNGPRIVVRSTGLQQTMLTEFMNSYLQTGSAYTAILSQQPKAHDSLQYNADKSYLEETETFGSGANSIVVSFYALISMSAMFGAFRGKVEVEYVQANLSPQGARMNLAPVHKLKIFSCSFVATILIQFISLILLVAYMALVLNISFGSQLVPVLVNCFFASIMGVTFGAMVAALVKTSEGVRLAILISISLFFSALAGMVYPSLKYIVTQAVPVMAYLNPANLISDSFYALHYYGVGSRFYLNNGLMLAFSIVFTLVVYLVTRRQKYASL